MYIHTYASRLNWYKIELVALILLIIIYVVFISLGLPDGVLGSAWPAIQQALSVPLGWGGFIALVATVMTIISSLATASLVRRLGVGMLLTISTGLTALALLGFSQVSAVEWLVLLAIPLGLGAGAIDSALNNYVANHYKAHHMNWLHAFWGVGATLGPIIFAASLATTGDWHAGYLRLGIVQIGIVIVLLLSLPLWGKVRQRKVASQEDTVLSDVTFALLLKERAVRYSFLAFLLYVGIEVGAGLWLASYLVKVQSVSVETASFWTGVYYGAITVGRILTGFISFKVSSRHMIRAGLIVSLIGVLLLVLHLAPAASLIGIVLIGLGFAPVYPGLIHDTPERFGAKKSAKVMSLQMVGGYIGASTIPPFIGLLSGSMSLSVFAYIIPLTLLCLAISTEQLNRR